MSSITLQPLPRCRDSHLGYYTLSLISTVSVADSFLLRAPLYPELLLDKTWAEHCADLSRAVERLPRPGWITGHSHTFVSFVQRTQSIASAPVLAICRPRGAKYF